MPLPIGNTGSRTAVQLSTLTMPEFFDLQIRVLEENQELKEIANLFNDRLMALYRRDPFVNGQGEWKTITETDSETYGAEQPEGTTPNLMKFGIGRTLNYTYVDYGMSVVTTERAMRSNKYSDVFSRLVALPRLLQNRRYLDGVHQLTFGDSVSYVNMDGRTVDLRGIDGLAIFSASHTFPHASGTWSNIEANNSALSKAGILAVEKMFKDNIKDGMGARRVMTPNTIIISDDPTQVYNAKQLLNSTTDNTTNQANPFVINALNSYRLVILPQLDSDANGNIDSGKSKWWIMGRFGSDGVDMRYSEAVPITMRAPSKNELNGNVISAVKGSWIFKIISGKGMVISKNT